MHTHNRVQITGGYWFESLAPLHYCGATLQHVSIGGNHSLPLEDLLDTLPDTLPRLQFLCFKLRGARRSHLFPGHRDTSPPLMDLQYAAHVAGAQGGALSRSHFVHCAKVEWEKPPAAEPGLSGVRAALKAVATGSGEEDMYVRVPGGEHTFCDCALPR